ncbi:MAG: carboxylesterase family protein, partial [Lachnospiraceae bacterium]|nr:carboxylesterase family protein [Lachnospiraceae bacterium]
IPFIFGTLDKMTEMNGTEYSEEEYRFMEVMSSYWANFIKSGDPNGEGLFPWPMKTDEPVHIRLDIPCSMEADIWRPEHEVIVPPVTAWLMARMEDAKKTK